MKKGFFAKGALDISAGGRDSLTRSGKVIRRTTPLPPIEDEVQFPALSSARGGKKHKDPKVTTSYANVFIPEALQNILNEHSSPPLPDLASVVCNGKYSGVVMLGNACPSFGGTACSCSSSAETSVATVPVVRSPKAMNSAPTTSNNQSPHAWTSLFKRKPENAGSLCKSFGHVVLDCRHVPASGPPANYVVIPPAAPIQKPSSRVWHAKAPATVVIPLESPQQDLLNKSPASIIATAAMSDTTTTVVSASASATATASTTFAADAPASSCGFVGLMNYFATAPCISSKPILAHSSAILAPRPDPDDLEDGEIYNIDEIIPPHLRDRYV